MLFTSLYEKKRIHDSIFIFFHSHENQAKIMERNKDVLKPVYTGFKNIFTKEWIRLNSYDYHGFQQIPCYAH